MPLPSPKPEESQADFISSCVRKLTGEYETQQALAICYQQYKNKK
jgi:hypothetical protein